MIIRLIAKGRSIEIDAWLGIVVPAGTPKDRVEKLGAAFNKIVETPEMSGRFAQFGTIPHPLDPAAFAAYLAREDARWSEVVKTAHATVD